MKTIAGKKALVTGAASGIGQAIAVALARKGAELYLLDIDESGLTALAQSLRERGAVVVARRCDLADRADLDARLAELAAAWGGVDIVVNNAGLAYYGPTDAMSDRQWELLVEVNLLAPAQIIRRLLPALKERGEARIVNIASVAGLVGLKRAAAYSLTKFGLVGFSDALRSELARYGIGVSVVCPGYVRTGIFRSSMTAPGAKTPKELPRWLGVPPEVVAEHVLAAIRHNRSLVVVTWFARLLWRIKRLAPALPAFVLGGHQLRKRAVGAAVQSARPEQRKAA
jgi:short-subunit dehydrogenase